MKNDYQIEKDMLAISRSWEEDSLGIELVLRTRLSKKFQKQLVEYFEGETDYWATGVGTKTLSVYKFCKTSQECHKYAKEVLKVNKLGEWDKSVDVAADKTCSCKYTQHIEVTDKFNRCEGLDALGLEYKIELVLSYTNDNYKLPATCTISASPSYPVIVCNVGGDDGDIPF